MPAILGLFSSARAIGIALCIAALAGLVWYARHEAALAETYRIEARQALDANRETLATLDQERAHHTAVVASLERVAAEKSARDAETVAALTEIRNAPVTHACADSPAMHVALERLRERSRPDRSSPGPAGDPAKPVGRLPAPAVP